MRSIIVMFIMASGVCIAAGEHNMDRAFIAEQSSTIRSTRENLVDKKVEAIQLCTVIDSLVNLTHNDAAMLARHLTLADPRRIEGKLLLPSEIFPSVRRLVELGPKGAQAAIDSIRYEHVNKHQLPINIAYVLRETVGVEVGISMVKQLIATDALDLSGKSVLAEVDRILVLQSNSDNEGP